jgi:DNA-binding CsgD family transcriptional regulator
MKVAAVLTSRVMEAVCRLPGVATLDWCDRAAAALCRLHHPCSAAVLLATVDNKGFLSDIEVAGAAASVAEAPGTSIFANKPLQRRSPLDSPELVSLRDSLRVGDWIGWNIGQMHENLWYVSTASSQGLLQIRGESPLTRRWEPFQPAEILLAAVNIPGATPGRMLLCEIASSDPAFRDTSREQVVLAASLPMLAQRIFSAVGPEAADKHRWLTPREEMILWQLVAGKKVPQIAAELHRSIYTVHDHVKSLHRKLGASNRGQLVARALGHLGPLNAEGHVQGIDPGSKDEDVLARSVRNGHARAR